jgi:hypothetical protein
MRGDWKSADEIEADIESGELTTDYLPQMVADLWRRADELEKRVAELERERDERQGDRSN